MISAQVIADSCSIEDESNRITTLICKFPKFLQAQFNTHRVFSKNSASSRALPFSKIKTSILYEPVIPIKWGMNQPGMSAEQELSPEDSAKALEIWLGIRDFVLSGAEKLNELKVHKQIVNRVIEPFFYTTVLVTSTEWQNFFNLRCEHGGAQDEMQDLAIKIREAIKTSVPKKMLPNLGWHIPFFNLDEPSDLSLLDKIKISIARCARVSYVNFDGNIDIKKDFELYDRLASSGHWSPFEHIAQCLESKEFVSRNFSGWSQYREQVDGN